MNDTSDVPVEPAVSEGGGTPDAEAPAAGSTAGAGASASPRRAGEGAVAEVVGDLLGRLWRRGRVEMEKATRQARERLTLRQLKGDRDRMYQKLGKEARHLLEGGELDHPGVRRAVERIRELEERIREQEDQLRAVGLDPDAGGDEGEDTPEQG